MYTTAGRKLFANMWTGFGSARLCRSARNEQGVEYARRKAKRPKEAGPDHALCLTADSIELDRM